MVCEECNDLTNEISVEFYPIRWKSKDGKVSTIGLIACRKHAKEIIEILRKYNILSMVDEIF